MPKVILNKAKSTGLTLQQGPSQHRDRDRELDLKNKQTDPWHKTELGKHPHRECSSIYDKDNKEKCLGENGLLAM